MGPADQAAVFQPRQVAANAGGRRSSHGQDLLDRCAAGSEEELDDPLGTKTERAVRHFGTILHGVCKFDRLARNTAALTS